MRSPVFVDASAWIALLNADDRYHRAAKTLYDDLLRAQTVLITSTWTLYEALSLLKTRRGHAQAQVLWEIANNPKVVRCCAKVTDEIEAAALDLFFRYQDKTWGVVDCTTLVIMELAGCCQAFAFDRHFREAGRQRGFDPIPALKH